MEHGQTTAAAGEPATGSGPRRSPAAAKAPVQPPPGSPLDDITVVIPTVGRALLRTSLARIAGGSARPARIIVVDQSSSAEVAAWVAGVRAEGIEAEHVPSSQRGRAAGVNRGLERVTTRFAAVTDDDCFAEPDWLRALVRHLRAMPEAIVTGRVEPEGEEEVLAVRTDLEPSIQRRPLLRHDSMCGGNMGCAMAVVERIGLFDEDPCLRTAEDCEYSYRALRAGVPIVYAPDAVVRHVGWRAVDERAAQYRSYARSHGGFYGKYLRRGDLFIALRVLVHLARASRRVLRGAVASDRELVRNGRAYLAGLVPGIVAGWRSGRSP